MRTCNFGDRGIAPQNFTTWHVTRWGW